MREAGTNREAPSLVALVHVVLYKKLILLVRYPANTASMFVTLFILFSLIFFGGRAVAGSALTESLDGIIVGFLLYTLSIIAYQGLARNIMSEAQWGTLERLYMSPHRLGTVMAVMVTVEVLLSFLWGSVFLVLMMSLTGRWLTVDLLTVVPLTVLTLMPVTGISFAFAGIALLYKRIGNLFGATQLAFVGLIAAPVGDIGWLKFLPVAQGSYLTRRAMANNVRVWEFPAGELAVLVGVAVGYLAVGYYCFHWAQVRARSLGVLGHY